MAPDPPPDSPKPPRRSRDWDRDLTRWERERRLSGSDDQIIANTEKITLLIERQQSNMERLDVLERKQQEYDKLLNRGLGAIGLIAMLGVFLSWLFSIGGEFFQFFRR